MRIPLLAAALLALARPSPGLDLELYARLLERHTREVPDIATVRVDYAALREEAAWSELVASLGRQDPGALETPAERKAFWINAYNVLAIDLVVEHDPPRSIRDIGSLFRPVWKREAGRVGGGRRVSLDEIEHQILRPLGDPRIHGAIVCASLSCPPLRREPYRAEVLDAQLDDNVRRWLADPRKGVRLDASQRTLHLSAIFDWFSEDFTEGGGVLAFVARYAPPEIGRWVRSNGERARMRTLDYDWRLNALAAAGGP